MIWLYFLSTNEGSMSAVSTRVTDAPSTLAQSFGPVHSERWKIIIVMYKWINGKFRFVWSWEHCKRADWKIVHLLG